jgi:O-antigen ligase
VQQGGERADDISTLQKPLEHFRGKTKRLQVHPMELAVLWVIAFNLVFLPWALGGMRPWTQFISLGLALLGFVLALIPRQYDAVHTGAGSFRLIMWPRLVRFPLFWLGLALLGLVLIHALNPAWVFVTDGKGWWMRQIPANPWLPKGVEVPFTSWGPWRMLLVYGTVWLTICSLWVGITRRRSIQAVFLALAVNGLLLALFGIAQRLLRSTNMFWLWTPSNVGAFFSSFAYKNHAGAYLLLALAVTGGLAGWYYLRGLRRLEKSNPAGVFTFFATCIAVAILVSYARGATLVMLVFLCLSIGAYIIYQFRIPAENRRTTVSIILLLLFGFFLKTGLEALESRIAWDRLSAGLLEKDASLESRRIATRAALEMLGDHWQLGTGSGSFRFLFPIYQQRYPEIFSNDGRRMFWEHAHNDLVEVPIELGVPGMLILLAGAAYVGVGLIRSFFWENALSTSVVLGLLLLLAYSWWDFPFQNPAILLTWCTCWVAVLMWTQMEESNVKA